MSAEIIFNQPTLDDLEAIGRIAYQTGFFGESAEVYFPEPRLFSDLWIDPYLHGMGSCGWIVKVDHKSLGYCLATADLSQYRRWMVWHGLRVLGWALLGRYKNIGICGQFLARMARFPSRLAPIKEYPAQIHLNVLAEGRGLGLGRGLLERQLSCLQANGVVGVQLSTTEHNQAAVALYQKLGFSIHARYSSPLWQPWLGHELIHLTMVKSLITQAT